ncbi:MAG TPA: hypothetical protein VFS21_10455 [Roseiflexaceae bacterium]|nr:hypothetical protein [Roseiflexaceae bacterium]
MSSKQLKTQHSKLKTPMFTPGLELCGRFYQQAVRPLIERGFPGLPHAAARLGPGSDVLGFDTPMSTDHDWGPTVQLFLREQDAHLAPQIVALLARELPHRFEGYPVDLAYLPDEPGTRVMSPRDSGPVEHRVTPLTLRGFVAGLLGWDPDTPLAPADWLTFPAQRLRELTAGAVYHDDTGELTALRAAGLVPPRCLAVPSGGRLAAHRPGGASDAARRLCWRRAGLGADRSTARARCDGPGLSDRAPVCALPQVVRHGFRAAGEWPCARAHPAPGPARRRLARTRGRPVRRL